MNYLRYAMVHATVASGIILLYALILALFDFSLMSSFFPILPSMLATARHSEIYAKTTGRVPELGTAWRLALVVTAISVALLGGYYLILSAVYPSFMNALVEEIGRAIVGPTVLAIMCGVILLINRFTLTLVAKGALKAAAKRSVGQP